MNSQEAKSGLVDFHCHIDLYPDPLKIIQECERNSIHTLTVTTTPKAWPQNSEWTTSSKYVQPSLGLHPQLVADRYQEIGLFEQYLCDSFYIGEIGLDAGPSYRASMPQQQKVFSRILEMCDEAGNRVLSIHAVRSATLVLDLIEKHLVSNTCCPVLHWFSGSVSEAHRAIELGCYFSVNREMLKSTKKESLIKTIPIDRLLTETDGPFVQIGDVPISPQGITGTESRLANVLGISQIQLNQHILKNFAVVCSHTNRGFGQPLS